MDQTKAHVTANKLIKIIKADIEKAMYFVVFWDEEGNKMIASNLKQEAAGFVLAELAGDVLLATRSSNEN